MHIFGSYSFIAYETSSVYSKIEHIGRVCYKSEDMITEGSCDKFIESLINRGHESVIEHHVFVLEISKELHEKLYDLNPKYLNLTKFPNKEGTLRYLVSGSARGFKDLYRNTRDAYVFLPIRYLAYDYSLLFFDVSGSTANDIKGARVIKELSHSEVLHLSYEERKVHHYVSAKFICDRGVTHEIVRHRDASYSQESTRYCNYAYDKFGYNITVIEPLFFPKGLKRFVWWTATKVSEWCYMLLTRFLKASPQEARSVLNNSLKTEIIVTMNIKNWSHFFKLRRNKTAHPQMREVVAPLYNDFVRKDFLH